MTTAPPQAAPLSTRDSRRLLGGRRKVFPMRTHGTNGVPTSQSAHGEPYVRTTATTATPGASFHMIMHGPGPTDGTKTAWPVCRIFTTICALPWLCGTVSTRS